MRKYGCASVPVEAATASRRCSRPARRRPGDRMKTRSPSRQSSSRSLVRKLATTMRARLCIQPVVHELAHRRVDDRDSRCARAPGAQRRPRRRSSARARIACRNAPRSTRRMLVQQRDVEVAPDELVDPLLRRRGGAALARGERERIGARTGGPRWRRSADTATGATCRRRPGDRGRARSGERRRRETSASRSARRPRRRRERRSRRRRLPSTAAVGQRLGGDAADRLWAAAVSAAAARRFGAVARASRRCETACRRRSRSPSCVRSSPLSNDDAVLVVLAPRTGAGRRGAHARVAALGVRRVVAVEGQQVGSGLREQARDHLRRIAAPHHQGQPRRARSAASRVQATEQETQRAAG